MLPREKATVAGAWKTRKTTTSSHKMKMQDAVQSPKVIQSCFRTGLDAWILTSIVASSCLFHTKLHDSIESPNLWSVSSGPCWRDLIQKSSRTSFQSSRSFYTKFDSFHPRKTGMIFHMFVPTNLATFQRDLLGALAEVHRPRVVFATPWTCLVIHRQLLSNFKQWFIGTV